MCLPRLPAPATPTTRCGSPTATKARLAISPGFAERFGCQVIDGFGSSEGGVAISRTPDTPPGALGKLADGVAVLDPETGRPCPPASFGPGGELRIGRA